MQVGGTSRVGKQLARAGGKAAQVRSRVGTKSTRSGKTSVQWESKNRATVQQPSSRPDFPTHLSVSLLTASAHCDPPSLVPTILSGIPAPLQSAEPELELPAQPVQALGVFLPVLPRSLPVLQYVFYKLNVYHSTC